MTRAIGCARTDGPLPYVSGSASGSPAIGTMPVPFFPVLSATSCSTHKPNGSSAGGTISVNLSRPARAAAPMARPSATAGFAAAVPNPGSAAASIACAHATIAATCRPISAAGTRPKYDTAE